MMSQLSLICVCDGMPWRDSSSPDVRRIFAVQRPLQGIVLDVFTHALQRCLVADDVFVIIALPRKSVKAVLPDLSRCRRLERPHHFPDRRNMPSRLWMLPASVRKDTVQMVGLT